MNLESIINEFAAKICKHRGFNTPYELILKAELPKDNKDRERIVIIKAHGSTPVVYISQMYITACVLKQNKESNIPGLKDTIERALEFLPKMQHTLSLVPIAEAVALRKDSKRWYRANVPNLGRVFDDRFLSYTYSVTIEDTITGTSVTRNGKNLEEIRDRAKRDLVKLVQESEEMDEMREMIEDVNRAKKLEVKPNEVSISVSEGKIETSLEY